MAKRRPNGDGLVRKREDGRWEGRIVAGHKKDGSPIYRAVFAEKQSEPYAKASSAERAVRRGGTDRGQLHHARRMARKMDGRIQEAASASEHVHGI